MRGIFATIRASTRSVQASAVPLHEPWVHAREKDLAAVRRDLHRLVEAPSLREQVSPFMQHRAECEHGDVARLDRNPS